MKTGQVYEKAKERLLTDESTCYKNRKLWADFFEWEERKLKRTNNLARLDAGTYKTLNHYIGRFKNVNKWFNNKPWEELTKEDIQKIYDDLEDGVIKNRFGKRYEDRRSYYTKVFKAKPFKMAGKAEFAEEIFEFYRPKENNDVNFIEIDDFLKLPTATKTIHQKLLLWLAWDIGENIGSLLRLKKNDFRRQINPETNEIEYLVDLKKEILKRTRRARVEITNFSETTELLDIVLNSIETDDLLFNFGHRQALKFMAQCVNKTNVKCIPTDKNPTFKDLRSSMCCHLLKLGWSIEEVNSRLGHSPSSLDMVSRYANYLALDRHKPKKKISDNISQKANKELKEIKLREQLHLRRIDNMQQKLKMLETDKEKTNNLILKLNNLMQVYIARLEQLEELQINIK